MRLLSAFGFITTATVLGLSPLTQAMEANPESIKGFQPEGESLVVMIRFADHGERRLPSQSEVERLCNQDPTKPCSVQAWVTVSNNEAYYASAVLGEGRLFQALHEALLILEQTVDLSQFDANDDGSVDAITFLHSGYGVAAKDRVRSHQWSMQGQPWISAQGIRVDDYQIRPVTAVAAPSHLTVDVQSRGQDHRAGTGVHLSWQDNADNEDQMIIERCKAVLIGLINTCIFEPLANVAANVTRYFDQPGRGVFKYRVKALNETQTSAFSDEIEI